jgi:hypothetical protein
MSLFAGKWKITSSTGDPLGMKPFDSGTGTAATAFTITDLPPGSGADVQFTAPPASWNGAEGVNDVHLTNATNGPVIGGGQVFKLLYMIDTLGQKQLQCNIYPSAMSGSPSGSWTAAEGSGDGPGE